jgi:hypothetical protein
VEDQPAPIPEEVTSQLGRIIDMQSEGQSGYLPSNNGEKEIEEDSVNARVATDHGTPEKQNVPISSRLEFPHGWRI